jgi:hypothetical protein
MNSTIEDPSHEYIDCVVHNNKNTPDLQPQPLVFSQIKTSNIIDNCDEYYLSVIRWSLHSSIPVIIPDILTFGSTGPFSTSTDYWVDISFGTTPQTSTIIANNQVGENVPFNPENKSQPGLTQPLSRPLDKKDIYRDPFYFVYNVQHFLDMVNKALVDSFVRLRAIAPHTTNLASALPPRFVWNADTGKIEFLCTYEFMFDIDDTTKTTYFINMNVPLFNLFDTFQFFCNNKTPTNTSSPVSPVVNNYVLIFSYNYGIQSHQEKIGNTTKEVFINPQQSSSVPSWSPCQSITFNTFQIPVHNSLVASPDFLGQKLDTSLSQNTLSNVLTDFQLPLIRGDEYSNQMTYYIPTSEYRLFDLVSNASLKNLNIVVNWLDVLGISHPIVMKYGSTASIKIMLRKKNFNGV